MENTYNTKLDILCHVFGNHYGTSFYLLNTPIHKEIIQNVIDLIDKGIYSPFEIDEIIINKLNKQKK